MRSLATRALAAAPIAVVLALFARTTGRVAPAAGLALLLVASLFVPPLGLGARAQGFFAAMCIAAAEALVLALPPPAERGALPVVWQLVALAAVLAAITRGVLAAPLGGPGLTRALVLLGALACGATQSPHYPAWLAGTLVVTFASARLADPGRARLSGVARGELRVVAVLAIAGALGGGGALALPRLYDWTMDLGARLGATNSAGFSDRLELGSLTGMLQSRDVVLRVYGPRPDHLRGVVYTHYQRGRWVTRGGALEKQRVLAAASAAVTEVRMASSDVTRQFVPLEARGLGAPGGVVLADTLGVVRPTGGADSVWFQRGARDALLVAPPSADDLAVPEELRPTLERVLGDWHLVSGAPAERLAAMVARFSADFSYSLAYERPPGVDPIRNFLLDNRQGHCEYFASAMALLARAGGIPARVAGGYRVSEYNKLGGYHIVRERNAHAWVEAWIPGRGWQTFDPTPASRLDMNVPSETPWWSALWEWLPAAWAGARSWLAAASPAGLAGPPVAIALGITLWRVRKRLLGRRSAGARAVLLAERPLPCLERLLLALGKRGAVRARHETLERFAARLPDPSSAALLGRYCALRYGGVGDERALSAELDARARELERGTPFA